MARFRKKPVVIEAEQFTGHNVADLAAQLGVELLYDTSDPPEWIVIETPEGDMKARAGDWIIKGVEGELYPCRASVFEATYEPVD